jgi:hypothetical protein
MGCNVRHRHRLSRDPRRVTAARALGTLQGPVKSHMLGTLGARSPTAH